MHDFHDLQVWHRALDLAVRVHGIARYIDAAHAPGLRNQLCRAVTSIPANIAEGARQETSGQTARFLAYAIGSTSEVQSHLELAARLVPTIRPIEATLDELTQIRRMLCALRDYHRRKAAGKSATK